eukprot:TRINITY_DN10522_c0_g2_i2.p1 TRINITY_DN10522_c0_g2~~TRINITY_DN10522_c0_g2_i2.p1  ORF type:complete len:277 (+),score=95.30 TRINITY_DN10522_c0_g2_i2:45-875(+)
MQNDEVVWQIINHGFCSFKIKTTNQNFCRNEYNLTGLCNRSSCPLANSNYATVREEKGKCYLFVKTAERCHTPKLMWEKIELDKNYGKALEQIDQELEHWNKWMVHKAKQRLTKLRQMLIRIRRMKLQDLPELVPVKKKAERRERTREKKAEIAAHIEENIEKELLERLKMGTYTGIYNYNPKSFEKVMNQREIVSENEEEEEESEIEEEDDYEFVYDPNEIEEDEEELSEEENDMEDIKFSRPLPPEAKARKRVNLEIEYEEEDAAPSKQKVRDF